MEPATVQSLNPQGDLVVGVDGSQESFGALRWALRQAALSGQDRKSTRLNSSHITRSRMPSSA